MRTRVLVVEDSITVRKRLVEVLSADPDLQVAGEAEDGKQAIELCQRLRPDVITLDMMLPVMSGVAATEYIMAHCPTPILIVSASTNRGELFHTYDALAAGAVEAVDKPLGDERDAEWERHFVSLVKLVARIKVITHLRGKIRAPIKRETSALPAVRPQLLAVGASTGGPAAVLELLRGLGPDFPLPVLLVIHVSQLLGGAMAEWLDGLSPLRVSVARDDEPLPSEARVIMAPPDRHLLVKGGRLHLSDEPERHSCRPSVDVLFSSVAAEIGGAAIACLLTGMGKDGAAGLLTVRRSGGITIAQDEASSVIFGMPREAILLGAAAEVLPLDRIAPFVTRLSGGSDK